MPSFFFFFFFGYVQSLYLTHTGMKGLRFQFQCLHVSVYMNRPSLCTCARLFRLHLLARFKSDCMSLYMCIVAHSRPVCLTQHILHSLSFSLSPPPPPPASFCPPGTYMHVCRLCTVLAAVARANFTAMQPCVH